MLDVQYGVFLVVGLLFFFLGGTLWCFDSGSKWKWFFLGGLALYIIIPVIFMIIALYDWVVDLYIKKNSFY